MTEEKKGEIIDVTPDELADFKKWRTLLEAEKQEKKEEKKVDKKEEPTQWTCSDCGETLGPGDWTGRQLSRAHPDGCPRCGSTVATIE
jgi:rubrerythrin